MPDIKKMGPLRRCLHRLHMRTPFYKMTLKSVSVQHALRDLPPAPWPGMSDLGKNILQGHFTYFGQTKPLPSAWHVPVTDEGFFTYLHSFEWAYHLREVGGNSARRLARSLVASWVDIFDAFDERVWAEGILSQRLINLIGLYEFYGSSGDDAFRLSLSTHLKRQYIHLERMIAAAPTPSIQSLSAIVITGLAFHDTPPAVLTHYLKVLDRALKEQVGPYGFIQNHGPFTQFYTFKHLLYLRACLNAFKYPIPAHVQGALHKLALGLRLSVTGSLNLLEKMMTPFQRDTLNMALSKIPGKISPHAWVKPDSFLRVQVGKLLIHAHCRHTLHLHFSSLTTPLFTMSTDVPFAKAKTTASLTPRWADKNFLLHQSLTYCHKKNDARHARKAYINAAGTDIRALETLVGDPGKRMTFTMMLNPQVTKVSRLEKEGGILISSLKMGTWIFKITGASQLKITLLKELAINGDQRPCYRITFSAPFETAGYQLKWAMKLVD